MSIFDTIYIHPSRYRHFKAKRILSNARYKCEECGSKRGIMVHYFEAEEEGYKGVLGKGLGMALCERCKAERRAKKPVIAPAVVSKLRKKDACITSLLTSETDRPLPEGVTDKQPAL